MPMSSMCLMWIPAVKRSPEGRRLRRRALRLRIGPLALAMEGCDVTVIDIIPEDDFAAGAMDITRAHAPVAHGGAQGQENRAITSCVPSIRRACISRGATGSTGRSKRLYRRCPRHENDKSAGGRLCGPDPRRLCRRRRLQRGPTSKRPTSPRTTQRRILNGI